MNPAQLLEDVNEIKQRLASLEARSEPATLKEVQALASRPIELSPGEIAGLLLPEIKRGIPTTAAFVQAADDVEKQLKASTSKVAERVEQAAASVPKEIKVTGDVYGFTNWKAALIYGIVLLATVAVAWYTCNYYREQAQETVIFEQAKEVAKERDYYYRQIQAYKQKYPKYGDLFTPYDDKGFWKKFK